MVLVIAYLAAVVIGALLMLKGFDALRAWRFNRKMAREMELTAAYIKGHQDAIGGCDISTYKVVTAIYGRGR